MGIQDLDEEFQEGLSVLQEIDTSLISVGVGVEEIMVLIISLRRGSTTGVLNRGLDAAVIEAKNWWINMELGRSRWRGRYKYGCNVHSGG